MFQYPKESGTWYKGSHEPLITKDVFDTVQKQLVSPEKVQWGSKKFSFRRFLTCYTCGSTVVGEEKLKDRVDGGKNRHIYYHCSRQVDISCKEPYLPEAKLTKALLDISDKLTFDKATIEPGLSRAIHKFGLMIGAANPKKKYTKKEIIKSYTKYVLEQGSDSEKTQLVRNLNVKLAIHDRKIVEV